MNAKRYITVFAVFTGGGLLLAALLVYLIDPFFHYHMPWFGMEPVVDNEIYQNAGLADHADYDAIIVGSSMSENFDAAWFDEAFGVRALKMTYAGATVENFRIAIDRAEAALDGTLKYVFGNLDTEVLRAVDTVAHPLPDYLYNRSIFDDVYYLLNKDVIIENVTNAVKRNRNGTVTPLSEVYQWYSWQTFSKENALKGLTLPEEFLPVPQEAGTISDTTILAVDQIKRLADQYPETTFCYYYSPYSMARWYSNYKNGSFITECSIMKYSVQELLKCENVRLYFPITYEIITDLDNYKDSSHYNMYIQYYIFEEIRDDTNRLTTDNYERYLTDFQNAVVECDFEAVFR